MPEINYSILLYSTPNKYNDYINMLMLTQRQSCLQRGPNKVPVFALILVTVTSLLFVFIGKVNTLGPIVTMPFMLTYAAVDYAYFVLAMTFDKQKLRDTRFGGSDDKLLTDGAASPVHTPQTPTYGAIQKTPGDDLDKLFPERCFPDGQTDGVPPSEKGNLGSPTFYSEPPSGKGKECSTAETDDTTDLLTREGNY